MKVIGIHYGHNSSASLLEDGKITFAIQEERLSRLKNTGVFPVKSIKGILNYANMALEDVDLVVFESKNAPASIIDTKRENRKNYNHYLKTKRYYLLWCLRKSPAYSIYKLFSKKRLIKYVESLGIPRNKIKFVDHHLSHASAAYYASHFNINNERILVLTLDGGGDGLCSSVYIGENGQLNKIAESQEENSIGNLYECTTFYLGFTPLEHEYKLMGMAPYTNTGYTKTIENKLANLITVDNLKFKKGNLISTFPAYSYPILKKIYRLERFDTICGAIQNITANIVIKWVKNAIKKTDIHKIALGGGVFMNVKLNQRIMELPEVEDIFMMPSCGDESNALGAAYQTYAEYCIQQGMEVKNQQIQDLYLGVDFTNEQIENVLENEKVIGYYKSNDIEKAIAELLSQNKIVARFNGRMEWGARALGNRSILANASNFLITRDINKAIKMRDFWMPFAPSIMEEKGNEYIVNPKNIRAPYMMLTFNTKEKRKDIIAATQPFDQTARPQIVTNMDNPKYHKLLQYYYDVTGFGGLLNTSFNVHGEPIVCTPQDAIHTLMSSDLKYLAIGDYFVTKNKNGQKT